MVNGPFKGPGSFGTDLALVTASLIAAMALVLALLDGVGLLGHRSSEPFGEDRRRNRPYWDSLHGRRKYRGTSLESGGGTAKRCAAAASEARMRFAAIIKAFELFKVESSEDHHRYDIAGALLTPCSVNGHQLALHLLNALWPRRLVDARVATTVIDAVYKRAELRLLATRILADNVSRCAMDGGIIALPEEASVTWPSTNELPGTRVRTAEFFIRVLTGWEKLAFPPNAYVIVGHWMLQACVRDSSPMVRNGALDALRLLAKTIPNPGTAMITAEGDFVTLKEMLGRAQEAIAETADQPPEVYHPILRKAMNDLRTWAAGGG
jgi:hypothetical protein